MKTTLQEKIDKARTLNESFEFDKALALCEDVLKIVPQNRQALSIAAACKMDMGDYENAIPMFVNLIKTDSNDMVSITNLSAAMRETAHIEESEKLALMAFDKRPNDPLVLQNLGQLYNVTGRHSEAKRIYINLCSIDPKNILGHLALGNLLILEGEQKAGLRELEIGHSLGDDATLPGFRWNGMNMPDQRLLVLLDQGFGDAVQHASRIKSAAFKCTGGVIICGPAPILPLFKNMDGVHSVVEYNGETESYGAYCKISSLAILGCEAESTPYLNVTPTYPRGDKPLVGLSWKTRPIPRARAVPLEFLAAEFNGLDVDFISLHNVTTEAELKTLPMKTANVNTVEDLAGIIASCDMVITVDSLAVHIAGAMEKRGMLLLASHWDYKWGLDETICPLYPSFDMARQEKMGDWTVPVISAGDYIESMLHFLKE